MVPVENPCTNSNSNSAKNLRTGYDLVLFQGANCEGEVVATVAHGDAVPDVHALSARIAAPGEGDLGGD